MLLIIPILHKIFQLDFQQVTASDDNFKWFFLRASLILASRVLVSKSIVI